jgi:hypothetical protein
VSDVREQERNVRQHRFKIREHDLTKASDRTIAAESLNQTSFINCELESTEIIGPFDKVVNVREHRLGEDRKIDCMNHSIGSLLMEREALLVMRVV